MSADLKDFRGKITGLAWCYLEAEHRAGGQDQLLEAEGISGNLGEHQGTSGKGA